MNHAAVNYEEGYFIGLIDRMLNGKLIPCEDCRNEFQNVVRVIHVFNICDQVTACEWAFRVHNRINAKLGKPQYKWETAMREYGFPAKVTK